MLHRRLSRSRAPSVLAVVAVGLLLSIPQAAGAQLVAGQPQELAAPAPIATQTLSWPLSDANFDDGYVDQFGNAWMYHALRWKAMHANEAYTPSAANLPLTTVDDSYATTLNLREEDGGYYDCVFPGPGDPSGGWVSADGVWRDYEVFVWFALATQCHSSPLYANIRQGNHKPVVIREMTATISWAGCDTVECMCADWWDCSADPAGWMNNCVSRANGRVDATSMKYDEWNSNYVKNKTLSGQDLWQAFSDRQQQYRDLVYDPVAEVYDRWVAEGLVEVPTLKTKAAPVCGGISLE